MTDKTKNILSNIFGLVLWSLVVYEFFNERDYKMMIGLALGGTIALAYKMSQTRGWLDKLIGKKIN